MRHLKAGRKLKRTSSHRRALMRNLATALFQHKKIETTEAKAKELRPFAEKLLTKAKHALAREKQGLLPEGQTIDLHSRRVVARQIQSKAVLQELFDTIAPAINERPGGYTRIIKSGFRRGDAGDKAIIELVDWSAPQDGSVSLKRKKKSTKAKKATPQAKSEKVKEVKSSVAEVAAAQAAVESQLDAESEPVVIEEIATEATVTIEAPENAVSETSNLEPDAKSDDSVNATEEGEAAPEDDKQKDDAK